MISNLDFPFTVSSLTTLSCPHRGSSFADWIHEKTPQELYTFLAQVSIDITGIQNLTTLFLKQFNESVRDKRDVKYYSFAARTETPPAILKLPFSIVSEREGKAKR